MEQAIGEPAGGVEDVLAVVEDQQHLPLAQEGAEEIDERPPRRVAHLERRGHRRHHQLRVGEGRELDEPRAVGEARREVGGHRHGEPRLADAAAPREREQARRPHARRELTDLRGAPHERRERARDRAPRRRRRGAARGARLPLRAELPVERARLGRGLGGELALEQEAQLAVGVLGRAVGPARRERRHQGALGALAQRIGGDRDPEPAHRGGRVGAGEIARGQRLLRVEVHLGAGLARLGSPALRAALEQRPAVPRHGGLEIAPRHRLVEGDDVDVGARQIEREGVRRRRAEPLALPAEGAAQPRQLAAQIRKAPATPRSPATASRRGRRGRRHGRAAAPAGPAATRPCAGTAPGAATGRTARRARFSAA